MSQLQMCTSIADDSLTLCNLSHRFSSGFSCSPFFLVNPTMIRTSPPPLYGRYATSTPSSLRLPVTPAGLYGPYWPVFVHDCIMPNGFILTTYPIVVNYLQRVYHILIRRSIIGLTLYFNLHILILQSI